MRKNAALKGVAVTCAYIDIADVLVPSKTANTVETFKFAMREWNPSLFTTLKWDEPIQILATRKDAAPENGTMQILTGHLQFHSFLLVRCAVLTCDAGAFNMSLADFALVKQKFSELAHHVPVDFVQFAEGERDLSSALDTYIFQRNENYRRQADTRAPNAWEFVQQTDTMCDKLKKDKVRRM